MGDMAKIIEELSEPIENYVARFNTVRTKRFIVMIKRVCVMLIQDGLL